MRRSMNTAEDIRFCFALMSSLWCEGASQKNGQIADYLLSYLGRFGNKQRHFRSQPLCRRTTWYLYQYGRIKIVMTNEICVCSGRRKHLGQYNQ